MKLTRKRIAELIAESLNIDPQTMELMGIDGFDALKSIMNDIDEMIDSRMGDDVPDWEVVQHLLEKIDVNKYSKAHFVRALSALDSYRQAIQDVLNSTKM